MVENILGREEEELLLLSTGWTTPEQREHALNDVRLPAALAAPVEAFVEGRFAAVFDADFATGLLSWSEPSSPLSEDELIDRVKAFLDDDDGRRWERQFSILLLGAASLQRFVQDNWTGPPSEPLAVVTHLSESQSHYRTRLAVDEEPVFAALRNPECLWLAKVLLGTCGGGHLEKCPTVAWWRVRYVHVHQQVLEERCPSLFAIVAKELQQEVFESLADSLAPANRSLLVQLCLEAFHVSLLYYDHAGAARYLNKALESTGLSLSLTGVLGKRTHFQQRDVAQLALKVKRESSSEPADRKKDGISVELLPKDLRLNDEVRLDSVKFKDGEELQVPALDSIDQAVILGYFTQIQKTNAIHRLVNEELMTYLNILLSNPQNWAIQSASLLQRSKIESSQSRSIERSMTQIQALFDQFDLYEKSAPGFRLQLIYCTPLPPRRILEKEMAKLFRQMGAVNSALEVYLRLEDWEEVIACYNVLQRRDKAEAVVRQQLAAKETPVLWCHLGDATDDPEYYFRAWELSNHRSARAQKSLGMLYFRKKEYIKCIPYLEKSVEINAIQLDTWFSLAFAAMQAANWELTAKAYRRCVNLEPDNFEAWNNLSNAYVRLKQKSRAWRTLQEALKCNYEDWRIWENYILVSVDCGAFSEVINAYHRILDLKEKHLDNEVLGILVKAVTEGMLDNEGKPAADLFHKLSQLFGRLTSVVTNNGQLWRLYGKLVSSKGDLTEESLHKVVQYYQKSHRSAVQTPGWEKDTQTCREVLDLSLDLANAYLQIASTEAIANQNLSSAKLMLNSTISKIGLHEKSTGAPLPPEIASCLQPLKEKLLEITEKLKTLSSGS